MKKTTALSYRKNAKKTQGYKDQVVVLQYLLLKSKTTKFGLAHDYASILNNSEVVQSFQQSVPIMDYDAFYEKWLKYSILGEKDNMLHSLKKAIDLNPRYKMALQQVPDFQSYRNDPEFMKLSGR